MVRRVSLCYRICLLQCTIVIFKDIDIGINMLRKIDRVIDVFSYRNFLGKNKSKNKQNY
jgi:hypothetical protein